jgi:phosphoserine aminotransferase
MPAAAVHRVYNFSSGPCMLPLPALQQVQDEFLDFQGQGASAVELSHRSKTIVAVHEAALALVRELLAIPASHKVLFLGGGATMQFAMVPMNLLHGGRSADYTNSGAWAKKAIADAKLFGQVNTVFDGGAANFTSLPDPATPGAVKCSDGAAYLHLTSNETIGGLQWKDFPKVDVPLVADMSSDIMSRPIPWERFGLVYAGAQKNIGPAGVALVVIREDVLAQCAPPKSLPNYFAYQNHVDNDSMLNTPPVFQIYMIKLVLEWLKGQGGLSWAQDMAAQRSTLVYQAITKSGGFYRCPVDARFRSVMNVVFRLPSEDLEARFAKEASAAGLSELKGHRSVGGCRASLYNAMPIEGVQALVAFMADFAAKNG